MKKLVGISSAIALSCLLCVSNAYSVPTYGFDSTGTDGSFDQVSGFKFAGTGGTGLETENAPTVGPETGNGNFDIWSETNFITETFTEQFTLLNLAGLNSSGSVDLINLSYLGTNILLDVDLNGTITTPDANGAYDVSFNTDGTSVAQMYLDVNGDYDYVAADGDVSIADLELTGFIPFGFEPSLLGLNGGTSVDIEFTFTGINDQYWDTAFEDLVNSSFMLAITQGDLTLVDLLPDGIPANGIQYQGWNVIAVDAALTAVPEPATMLLFGAGLIGLAGIGRRKRS